MLVAPVQHKLGPRTWLCRQHQRSILLPSGPGYSAAAEAAQDGMAPSWHQLGRAPEAPAAQLDPEVRPAAVRLPALQVCGSSPAAQRKEPRMVAACMVQSSIASHDSLPRALYTEYAQPEARLLLWSLMVKGLPREDKLMLDNITPWSG